MLLAAPTMQRAAAPGAPGPAPRRRRYAPRTPPMQPGDAPDAPRVDVRPITEASTFGAGGISSTLADWALWDEALHGGHILSLRAMEVLFTTQHLADGSDRLAFGMSHVAAPDQGANPRLQRQL
ncbi:MAG: hypothetical protein IPL62_12005 [Caulobacteraceae bacterium]|nr:hypothetical protein [Caulobacteraceae bacterium]